VQPLRGACAGLNAPGVQSNPAGATNEVPYALRRFNKKGTRLGPFFIEYGGE